MLCQVHIKRLQLSIRDRRQTANARKMSRHDRRRADPSVQMYGMFERMENVARLHSTYVEGAQNRH